VGAVSVRRRRRGDAEGGDGGADPGTPTTPKITRALRLLLDELNTHPPRIPGDPRPITYTINTT